jgi:hypothetical protein
VTGAAKAEIENKRNDENGKRNPLKQGLQGISFYYFPGLGAGTTTMVSPPVFPRSPGAPVFPGVPVAPLRPENPVAPVAPGAPGAPAGPGTATGAGFTVVVSSVFLHALSVNAIMNAVEMIHVIVFLPITDYLL